MKKITKYALSLGAVASLVSPLIASSCLLTVDSNTRELIDYAKNFEIKKIEDYAINNPNATNTQKLISDIIKNNSIYVTSTEYLWNLRLNSNYWDANRQKIAELNSVDEALEVFNYYFKNTPFNYTFLTRYKYLFDEKDNNINVKSLNLIYKTQDQIYQYFYLKYLDAFNQGNTLDEKVNNLFKYALSHGLKINNNQTHGMRLAQSPVFIADKLNSEFLGRNTDSTTLLKPIDKDSPLYEEFVKNPLAFLNNPKYREEYSNLYNLQQRENQLTPVEQVSLSNIRNEIRNWITNTGTQPQDIARLLAIIMYYALKDYKNLYDNVQVLTAYSKNRNELVYYIELFDKVANEYKLYNIEQIYNAYQESNDKDNFITPYVKKDIFNSNWTFKPTILVEKTTNQNTKETIELNATDADYVKFINEGNFQIKWSNKHNETPAEFKALSAKEIIKILSWLEKTSNADKGVNNG
ncbi:hypothetical protein VBM87_01025 [Mycoplasma sp. 744]|uniref:hypothetical protein n=1 Tax=Mycoplasma sp. 744 TaxID=3108531 RepID=UPI002B1DE92F|nr:hypothetical protein [Mycoplasma sp. 744]MEA4115367.1 hypothetical protein [Mycoplasma sp. 744]